MIESALGTCLNGIGAAGTFASVSMALFLGGLLGGFTHCSLMCGPFVLMQMARSLENVSSSSMTESHRWRAALLLPYHLGRMTTYALLGAAMAAFVGGIALWWQTASGIVLGVAGTGMIAAILFPSAKNLPLPSILITAHENLLRFVAAGQGGPTPWNGYILGVVLGLLPCGMVYAALLAAAGTANIWQGALSMMAFTMGTVPGLVTAAIAGRMALTRLRVGIGPLARAGSVLTGLWLCIVSASLLFL